MLWKLRENNTGDTVKIFHVAGEQRQVVVDRCGRNEDVRLRDELAICAQLAANTRKLAGNRPGNPKHTDATEKLTKDRFMSKRIAAVVDALVDFCKGDDTDSETL